MKVVREVPVQKIEIFPDGRCIVWLETGEGIDLQLDKAVMAALKKALQKEVEVKDGD